MTGGKADYTYNIIMSLTVANDNRRRFSGKKGAQVRCTDVIGNSVASKIAPEYYAFILPES